MTTCPSCAALVADLEGTTKIYRPGECKLCDIIEQASETARPAIVAAVNGTMGAVALADILTRNGRPIGATTILKHRRKGH